MSAIASEGAYEEQPKTAVRENIGPAPDLGPHHPTATATKDAAMFLVVGPGSVALSALTVYLCVLGGQGDPGIAWIVGITAWSTYACVLAYVLAAPSLTFD